MDDLFDHRNDHGALKFVNDGKEYRSYEDDEEYLEGNGAIFGLHFTGEKIDFYPGFHGPKDENPGWAPWGKMTIILPFGFSLRALYIALPVPRAGQLSFS